MANYTREVGFRQIEKLISWYFVARAARFGFVHFAQIVKHTPPSFCAIFTNRKKIKKILIFFQKPIDKSILIVYNSSVR